MNKHEKQSRKKYDEIAANYDGTLDGRFTAKFKRAILELCDVSDGDLVLDVGCGNGTLINAIKQKGNVQAFGVDISPNMIAECKARYGGVEFSVSSAEALGFDDGSLDTVTICCVLHHLNDASVFIRETGRVLKTGGTLIIGEPMFPLIIRKIADWIVSPILRAGDNKVFSYKRLIRLLTDGGFEIVQVYKNGHRQVLKARKL